MDGRLANRMIVVKYDDDFLIQCLDLVHQEGHGRFGGEVPRFLNVLQHGIAEAGLYRSQRGDQIFHEANQIVVTPVQRNSSV